MAVLIPSLFWMDPGNPYGWLVMASLLLFGGLGFIDDFLKVRRKTNRGLTGVQKLTCQVALGLLVVGAIILLDGIGYYRAEFYDSATRSLLPVEWSQVVFPFFKNWRPDDGFVAINDGDADLAGQVAALKAGGYTGYYCLEPHQWDDRANATRGNAQQLLALLRKAP